MMELPPRRAVERARRLRKTMSLHEVLLWNALRSRPGGHRFRCQHPVGPFVLDFCCMAACLAIEIDGIAHDMGDRPARDAERDGWLTAKGFTVLRIPAADVLDDVDRIVAGIVAACDGAVPLHRPSDGPPPRSGEDF